MRELDLDFLSCIIAISDIAKVLSFGTAEVVHAVHIVNSFYLLLEKVFVVSKHISNVHRESDSGNSDRFVRLSLKDLHIGIFCVRNVFGTFYTTIWVIVDKILSILVLRSIVFAEWSLIGTKSNLWTTVVSIDDIYGSNTEIEPSTMDSSKNVNFTLIG